MDILLGSGRSKVRQMSVGRNEWRDLVTVDFNADHKPDVVWDLEMLPLPFADNSADEIHAYSVLEHTGTQGDWKFFFAQFEDLWRVLKPGGFLCARVPAYNSVWAWGDPSHKRIINNGSLVFLSQKEYDIQIGLTAMTDYRFCYKGDFETIYKDYKGDDFFFVLKAVK